MAIEVESVVKDGGGGTATVNVLIRGAAGRVRIPVEVPDHGDANANLEAARQKLLQWVSELSADLRVPLQ